MGRRKRGEKHTGTWARKSRGKEGEWQQRDRRETITLSYERRRSATCRKAKSVSGKRGWIGGARRSDAVCESAGRKVEKCCFLLPNKWPSRAESHERIGTPRPVRISEIDSDHNRKLGQISEQKGESRAIDRIVPISRGK
jgi:hypothetical protein